MLHHTLNPAEGHVFHVEQGSDTAEGVGAVDAFPVFAGDGVEPAGMGKPL